MVKMEIDKTSLNRTIQELGQLGNNMSKEASGIVEATAYKISSKAKNEHTFKNRTGRLQSSIHVSKLSGIGQEIGTNVDYAGYVHDGTSKIKGDPFLQRPFYQEVPKMKDKLKKLLNKKW